MTAPPNERRAEGLTTARIVAAAIELLDEGGIDSLTFRALAGHLSTGAGALYHHVANKGELLALATSAALDDALAVDRESPRPDVRATLLRVYDVVVAHPWVGTHLTAAPWQPAVLRLLDRVGSGLGALDVRHGAELDSASVLVHHLLGVAGQRGAVARSDEVTGERPAFIAAELERAVQGRPEPMRFLERIGAQLVAHDDREQFAAGVDIILAGVAARSRGTG